MLPAWATVAVSLGASLIAGMSAYLVARQQMGAQRKEQWHTRQIAAAGDFATRFVGAADAVEYAISHGDKRKASDDAVHLIGEITPLLGPVLLLFGPTSEAAREAKDAITELRRAGDALAGSRFPEASAAFRQANVRHADFQRAVLRTLGHELP